MTRFRIVSRVPAFAVLFACAVPGLARPPPLVDLARPAQHGNVSISPNGEYLAATTKRGDQGLLAIIDLATLKPVRVLDPEERGRIEQVVWANPRRVYVRNARVGSTVEQAYLEPLWVAVNVDGTRRRAFDAWLIDALADDDDKILVGRCSRRTGDGCWTYVEKSDSEGGRGGERIADAPVPNADFMADNAGQVRFAWAWNKDGRHQLWLLRDGNWTKLNDEADSRVVVEAVGVSRDGRFGFLRAQRRQGPDVIESIDFSSGERRVVLSDPVLDPLYLLWSADGREPIGAAYGLGLPRGRFFDPGAPDAKLLKQLEAAFPEDAVQLSGGAGDGSRALVTVWSDRDPGSYYLFDRKARSTALLLRAKPWLDPSTLAAATPVRFAARDGTELTGYLTLPVGAGGGPRTQPAVVLVHGGPFDARDDWGYDEEVQVLAAHGYAVLRVNFRGSAGQGRAWVESGYRQWGGLMQDDVTDATRWLGTQGAVDPARICIMGSSYGGYAALMGMVRAPGLYKCGVAVAAVTDLNIHWRWGDTHRTRWGRQYLEEAVGKEPAALRAASPVAHAAAIKADVLLVHGKFDDRVSFEHAKAMTAAMAAAGRPMETWFADDETHGIYGEDNRLEYYGRVLRFLSGRIGGRMPDTAGAQ